MNTDKLKELAMHKHPENKVGATHWATLPDGSIIFYKIAEADILLWAPFSQIWISPGIVPYTLYSFDDEISNVLELIAQRDELLAALEKVREDINWMLNSKQFLNTHVFDYLDLAIAKAVQP